MQMKQTNREKGYSELRMKKKEIPVNPVTVAVTFVSLNDHEATVLYHLVIALILTCNPTTSKK